MARTKVVAANWKMHKDLASARSWVAEVLPGAQELSGVVELGVAPSFVQVAAVVEALGSGPVFVAGQDLHEADQGAFTGDVSGPMLRDVGARAVLVGHSERRHGCGESLARIREKLSAALRHDLVPLLCVGETLEERRSGRTEAVLLEQLESALGGREANSLGSLILAYEPVWAIGTGERATVDQAGAAHRVLREWVAGCFGRSLADAVRIQYGGSVKPENAAELFADPDIDGALVGGASLEAGSFLAIARAGVGGA